MRVLVACEFSGTVRNAFRARGHDAYSCDLLESADRSRYHVQINCMEMIRNSRWDLMIAHPPCTYLSVSGIHWNTRRPGRAEETENAIEFVRQLLQAPIPRIAIENPVGVLSTRLRKPDQYVQPYQFGHNASKKTGLWLVNLPLLQATNVVGPERVVEGKPRWGNQTDSGQNRLGPSADRWALRSATYQGLAEAMADQWGNLA